MGSTTTDPMAIAKDWARRAQAAQAAVDQVIADAVTDGPAARAELVTRRFGATLDYGPRPLRRHGGARTTLSVTELDHVCRQLADIAGRLGGYAAGLGPDWVGTDAAELSRLALELHTILGEAA